MDNVQDKIKNIERKLAKSDIKDANNPGSGDDDFCEALDDFFELQNNLADTSPETIKKQQLKDKILRFKLGIPKQNDVIEDIKSILDVLDSLADKMIETNEENKDRILEIATITLHVLFLLADDIHKNSESLGDIDISEVEWVPEIKIIETNQRITVKDKDFLANMIKEIIQIMKGFDFKPDVMEVINLAYCWNLKTGLDELILSIAKSKKSQTK